MVSVYLFHVKTTHHFVKFQGEHQEIFYLPKETWQVMGRPKRIVVEVIPDEIG